MKIKQFTEKRFCLQCRGCCRFREPHSVWSPHLLKEEKKLLSPGKDVVLIKGKDDFICSFLDVAINKCRVYPLRPFECRLYPFLINRRSKKIFLAADLNCPFLKNKLEGKKFSDYVKYLTGVLNSQRIKKTLKSNPQIIQAYEEVRNIIELSSKPYVK